MSTKFRGRVKSDNTDKMKLTLLNFKAYVGFWEQMTGPDAEERFWKLHRLQEGTADSQNGEARVIYEGVPFMRDTMFKGSKDNYKMSGVINEQALGDGQDDGAPAPMQAASSLAGSSREDLCLSQSDAADEAPSVVSLGNLTSVSQRGAEQTSGGDEAPSGPLPVDNTPVGVLQRKKGLSQFIQDSVTELTSKQSPMAKVTKLVKAMNDAGCNNGLDELKRTAKAQQNFIDELKTLKGKCSQQTAPDIPHSLSYWFLACS